MSSIIFLLTAAAVPVAAADAAATPTEGMPLFDMIRAGGWVAFTIIVVSIVCISLAIQLFIKLQQEKAAVADLELRYKGRDGLGHEHALLEWSKSNPGLMADVLRAGVEASDEHREAAIQEEAAHYSGDLFRRADYLLFIGNIAPMLGLLGTVFGMMTSFNVLAAQGGASDPGELAGGISGALVTTCMGLIVALPALIFYTMLRNRIEVLVADSGRCIEHLLFPERKRSHAEKDADTAGTPVEATPASAPVKKVYMPEQQADTNP